MYEKSCRDDQSIPSTLHSIYLQTQSHVVHPNRIRRVSSTHPSVTSACCTPTNDMVNHKISEGVFYAPWLYADGSPVPNSHDERREATSIV